MSTQTKLHPLGILGACWGILGVSLLLSSAIYRLGKLALEAFSSYELTTTQWVIAGVWLVFMVISEGYRGFQKKFSPRVAARARYLAQSPRAHLILLAPLFCMGFFHATRKRMIVSYTITTMIICLILIVRTLEQPWRGIIDLGVISGLAWGMVSLWIFCLKAFFGKHFDYDPEVPESAKE